jgi:hypothetical protein
MKSVEFIEDAKGRTSVEANSSILLESWLLLEDAAKALDAGAPLSASVAIRAAVEAGAYNLATRLRIPYGYMPQPRRNDLGELRRLYQDRLRDLLLETGALSGELLTSFDRIEEDGNLVAHVAEKNEKRTPSWLLENQKRTALGQEGTQMYLFPREAEVRADLEDCAVILRSIAETFIRQAPIVPTRPAIPERDTRSDRPSS